MALTDIINGIVGVINTVEGVGKVHAYRLYAADEAARKGLFVADGVLNTWSVTREQTPAHDRGAGPVNVRRQHSILIEGFRAVTSAANSEQLHQERAEAIVVELENNRKLPGGAGWLSGAIQVPQFGMAMFMMTVLSWYAKITVIAEDVMQGG